MLKFIKGHMETITGIELYPLISLVIFFVFFASVILWAARINKSTITALKAMPLKEEMEK